MAVGAAVLTLVQLVALLGLLFFCLLHLKLVAYDSMLLGRSSIILNERNITDMGMHEFFELLDTNSQQFVGVFMVTSADDVVDIARDCRTGIDLLSPVSCDYSSNIIGVSFVASLLLQIAPVDVDSSGVADALLGFYVTLLLSVLALDFQMAIAIVTGLRRSSMTFSRLMKINRFLGTYDEKIIRSGLGLGNVSFLLWAYIRIAFWRE